MRRTSRRDGGAPRRALPTRAWGLPAGLPAGRVVGFTLVEVLLALVVLMVGIYAMLRIFPTGYSAVEMSQQRTIAAQLAEAELNRWRLSPDALPDAIVATDYTGALIPSTLTNNPDNLQWLLVYGEVAAKVSGQVSGQGRGNYRTWQVPPDKLEVLDRLGRPLIYSPNDLTPSQFDAVLGFEGHPEQKRSLVHPNWQPNSLYLPRTVIGEQIDIRRLGTGVTGVPFYLLSHAPLDILRYEGEDLPYTPSDDRTKAYVDIYDARPWVYVPEFPSIALGEREFGYGQQSGQLVFGPATSPGYDREFKVDYTYTDPATQIPVRVYGFTITVPQGSNMGDEPEELLPPGTDPNTIGVHERMVPVTDRDYANWLRTGQPWPRNAYRVDAETWITGRIEFSNALQVQPLPSDITFAKVDYRVRDWQVLVFDVEVPESGMVTLPIRRLKGPGYTNPPRQDRPQEVANGIRRYYSVEDDSLYPYPAADPKSYAYVVAVDRQNGEVLTDEPAGARGLSAWPKERLTRFRVDYQQGLLYFNYGRWEVPGTWKQALEGNAMVGSQPLHSRSGRTYRIFCRAVGDWAVQLSTASRLYARSSTGVPGGAAIGPAAGDTPITYAWGGYLKQIYFPLSEAGQVVAVDYYTRDGRYISGEVHSISGPDIKDLGQWVCRLSEQLREIPNAWGPVVVRGLSVRARVVWVTRGGASTLQDWVQAVKLDRPVPRSLRETWNQVTITTYLTRVPL